MLGLSGDEVEMLRDALVSAYPTRDALDELVAFRLNKPLEGVSPPADPLPTATLKVIRWAEAQGRTTELVSFARARNPGSPQLFEVAQALNLTVGLQGGATLESLVDAGSGFLNIAEWSYGLWTVERRVCAIELAGRKVGTGFLVGESAVLTNYHVVKPVHEGSYKPELLAARFDFKRQRNNEINVGVAFPVVNSTDWLIDYRPPSPVDELPISLSLPDPTELDYALVNIRGEPGQTRAHPDDTEPRGWFTLPSHGYAFDVGSFLLIAQHPDSMPMQLAIDDHAVVGVNGNGTRVQYRTNTLHGSSGSPCFNNHLDLVAIHHSGDPKYTTTSYGERNQGIPLQLVRASIVARDRAAALGA